MRVNLLARGEQLFPVNMARAPSLRRLLLLGAFLLFSFPALALPAVGQVSQGNVCERAIADTASRGLHFLKRDDALIKRALPVLSEWSGDPATEGLLPDTRDTSGLHAVLHALDSVLGPRVPIVLLSIVHWGYAGYGHLWQEGFAANVYVDAGFSPHGLEAILFDNDEIESARLTAFRALGRSDAVLGRLSAARQGYVCRLAASLNDTASTQEPVGDLLTGALEELAQESIANAAVTALLEDASVLRSAELLVRGRRLPSDWRMAPTPPLELYLNSSVGREIDFSIIAAEGTVTIKAGSIRSIGDTTWAMTPAIVTIAPSARHVVIATPSDSTQLSGSFTYSWRSGTVEGNHIEVHHNADARPFAMTAAFVHTTQ